MFHSPLRPVSAGFDIVRRHAYPSDDLGFLQRTHPLHGQPFGRLVYMADSIMQPMRRPGFGMHPHANVEVVSYVVDGELTHRDSAGNVGVVPAGGLQRITAGTGIKHDESNRTDKPLRMFQIWFKPDVVDVRPGYATIETAGSVPANGFRQVVGDGQGALEINADAAISLGRVAEGQRLTIEAASGRATLLYVVEGRLSTEGRVVDRQDQVRIVGSATLDLLGLAATDLLLIDSAL